MNKRKLKTLQFIILIAVIFVSLVGFVGYYPNVNVDKKNNLLFINKTDNFESVKRSLYENNRIKFKPSFELVADLKHYSDNVKPGRYELNSAMGNIELVNKLRAGNQDPLNISIKHLRTVEDAASKISEALMADSTQIASLLNNKDIVKELGFSKETIMAMFIPNTYEVYWTVNPLGLLKRMKKEYDRFWTKSRLRKAKQIGLTPVEVSILASIVDKETLKDEENRRVAGVYMNRLRKRIRLGADPTVIFALKDFGIRRVLRRHLKIDSPYNTYKHYGLPPGPICAPSISAIDGVLNYERHNYIYFCAKEDFSGEHNFTASYAQHMRNARAFQRELNRRKIY
jgi:UPF0755 protein